jgi:hypothetical protein
MACNYLTVSLMLLIAARRLGWLGRRTFVLLTAGIAVAAATTISPGLGGIFIGVGLWSWLSTERHSPAAMLALGAGVAAAALFLVAAAVTPIVNPTAPFLFHFKFLDLTLAPSPRMLTWIDSAKIFIAHPLLGSGIGADAAHVSYLDPSGNLQRLTDAHNSFLNIAAQCGLAGLLALLAIAGFGLRQLRPLQLETAQDVLRVGIAIGFAASFIYEGLTGSFEDARHLWVLFGLMLVADRLTGRSQPTPARDRSSSPSHEACGRRSPP